MKGIDARAVTVKQLLNEARFSIDYYQREYAWQEHQVRELIVDLTTRFEEAFDSRHARPEVKRYPHYFLGSIIVCEGKDGKNSIIDGQQRLTTLTLLLLFLHHLQRRNGSQQDPDLIPLIFSQSYGETSFNLHIPERKDAMSAFLKNESVVTENAPESVRNLVARYQDIQTHFPVELIEEGATHFVDWLLDSVHLVVITADTEEDAYSIFETMNDRGLSLSLPDMLKGYLLANVRAQGDQANLDRIWRDQVGRLRTFGPEADVDFFKNWLRAQYAESVRERAKGTVNQDYERIGSEFHRWVRDYHERLGLTDADDYKRFITEGLGFYARHAVKILTASQRMVEGLESVFFNADRGFTLQTQMLLAALDPTDDQKTVDLKLALVADFLDIWLARRAWNFRAAGYNAVRYTIFNYLKRIRRKSLAEISEYLLSELERQPETFAGHPKFRLHQQNYRQVRHILARLTYWVDQECRKSSHFADLIAEGRGRAYEIEHIWGNRPERFSEYFSPAEFAEERNRIGGLVLLQRGANQSLGDRTYEQKRTAYGQAANLLTRSLNPDAYPNDPDFAKLRQRTGLDFTPFDQFLPAEQARREELYGRIAEWVWNPARLELDPHRRAAPPVHLPISRSATERPLGRAESKASGRTETQPILKDFWAEFLAIARTDDHLRLHRGTSNNFLCFTSPLRGAQYNYVVNKDRTRVELYIDTREEDSTRRLFEALFRQRELVESRFGGTLEWGLLDGCRAFRVFYEVSQGGWINRDTWKQTATNMRESMLRFRGAFDEVLTALADKSPQGWIDDR